MKILLEKLFTKDKGFISATTTVYILMCISFISFNVIYASTYAISIENFEQNIEKQIAYESAISIVKKKHKKLGVKSCEESKINKDNKILNYKYSLDIETYCLREPNKNNDLPQVPKVRQFFDDVYTKSSEIKTSDFDLLKEKISSMYYYQNKINWIGNSLSKPPEHLDEDTLQNIVKMDPVLITIIRLNSKREKKESIVFYNVNKNKVRHIIYNKND